MFDPPDKEYDEVATSVDLADVISYYAKDFEVKDSKLLSYEWAINPLTNKVIFVLTTQNKTQLCPHPIPEKGPAQCKVGHWSGSKEHPITQ
jgi:hypothetical protein